MVKNLQYTLLLLIPRSISYIPMSCLHLQYTLLLLILVILFALAYVFIFTIHFATINTGITDKDINLITKFTIHFATINTNILKVKV